MNEILKETLLTYRESRAHLQTTQNFFFTALKKIETHALIAAYKEAKNAADNIYEVYGLELLDRYWENPADFTEYSEIIRCISS